MIADMAEHDPRGELMKIAVAGGTGCVGRLVVEMVRAVGHEPVVLARSTGVDLTTGRGLDEALLDVSTVIDVSNLTTASKKKSIAFFGAVTRNLLAAGERAGVTHHVALSIVGSDQVDVGYYMGKRRQEELLLSHPVPSSILRATQFFEFAARMLKQGGGGPFVLVPKMTSQPIAAREVADALVRIALDAPVGMASELAGPEQHSMPDMVRQLVHALGGYRIVIPIRMPGAGGKAMINGGLLPTGPGPRGRQTFDQWLANDAVPRKLGAPGRLRHDRERE
jgi:uncharacterized protein YbjT (DUF2867 family)